MTDATTGQGADGARRGENQGADGARRGEKMTGGPAGRAYGTDGRPKGPQGEGNAPLVAGHDTRDTSGTERRDTSGTERTAKGDGSGSGSASPLVAGPAGHEAAAKGQESAAKGQESAAKGEGSHRSRLLPHDECDKLSLRLQHAVAGFVDEPRNAVEEADHVMEEVASRVTDAMTQRRRTLRTSWQDGEDKHADAGDTEQLRLALRDYRELADRLLHL
ncbi:hypothetical protein ACWD3I_10120 [Streptomyces sp. NPDC002817]|uniref:hypothetical protein n=1 Tax=Streptomyces sp. NPDC088357 TaxID=3154655 RepID=UPI00342D2AE3